MRRNSKPRTKGCAPKTMPAPSRATGGERLHQKAAQPALDKAMARTKARWARATPRAGCSEVEAEESEFLKTFKIFEVYAAGGVRASARGGGALSSGDAKETP